MAAEGIAALGISWSAFLFQLINFLVLLVVLRIFAYPSIVRVLEARKRKIDEQLKNAAELERTLALAETKAEKIIDASHKKAQGIIEDASARARGVVEEAVQKAHLEAENIVRLTETRLDQQIKEARQILKKETAALVVAATEKVLQEKITSKKDHSFIDRALV